jgi:phage anti-repressor protein
MWNETSWEKFLQPHSGGRPEWVQEESVNIASALSERDVDAKYPFAEWIKEFYRELGNTEDELDICIRKTETNI